MKETDVAICLATVVQTKPL